MKAICLPPQVRSLLVLGLLIASGSLAAAEAEAATPAAADRVAGLRAKLGSELTFGRRVAIEKLGNLGPAASAAVPELVGILSDDPDEMARVRAAWALGQIKEPRGEVVPALVAALSSLTDPVSRSAADAILSCGKESLPFLAKSIASGDEAVSLSAAELHLRLDPGDAAAVLPTFTRFMDHADAPFRLHSIVAIGVIGTEAAALTGALEARLRDDDEGVRMAAVRALGEMKPGDGSIRAIAAVLEGDDSKVVRFTAAEILGSAGAGNGDALRALVGALDDGDKRTRACVVDALALFGASAVPPLRAAAQEESTHNVIRIAALEALALLGAEAEPALDDLIGFLASDDDWIVRHRAATALWKIGNASEAVASALRQAKDEDPRTDVKIIAAHALRQLEAPVDREGSGEEKGSS